MTDNHTQLCGLSYDQDRGATAGHYQLSVSTHFGNEFCSVPVETRDKQC